MANIGKVFADFFYAFLSLILARTSPRTWLITSHRSTRNG